MLIWSPRGPPARATLSRLLGPGRVVVESEDFEKPCEGDEHSASDPNHRYPGDLAITGGDLVCEVAANTEQLGCLRDGHGGAGTDDLTPLFVIVRHKAWSKIPGKRLCRDQLLVGKREVTEPGGNSQGALPVLRHEGLSQRHLELLMELFRGVVILSTGRLLR